VDECKPLDNGAGAWVAHGANTYAAESPDLRYGSAMTGVALSGVAGGVYVGGFFTDGGAGGGPLVRSILSRRPSHVAPDALHPHRLSQLVISKLHLPPSSFRMKTSK
jgi:hypothetical protein